MIETGMGTALLLTLIAGLATGLGGLAAFLTSRSNASFLAISLGFSGGVMLYVSFVEILAKSQTLLSGAWGQTAGAWGVMAGFFGGIAVIAVIDRLVPHRVNPHEFVHQSTDVPAFDGTTSPAATAFQTSPHRPAADTLDQPLLRTGLLTALAIAIHNFPEGFATFMAALQDPTIAVAITVAIALHNIPEGIAVAVPVFQATGSRRQALGLAFLSGLAEPAGALLGYLVLRPFLTDALFGMVFAAVAGIMVFISLDKLLPTAERYGGHHQSVYGLVAGMAVMAVSLVLLG